MLKKILIVGLGGIGQRHVRNIRQLLGKNADLIAYRQRSLSHVINAQLKIDDRKTVEEEYDIRVFTNLDEALSEKPDIALICNPSKFHLEIALKAANAGCHLFIEKPLSDSIVDVEHLINTVQQNGLIAMVGYQMRYHPCIIRLQEILASNLIGNLLSVTAQIGEYLPDWHPYEDYRKMYAARADLGGGVVLSQIHECDYLYALFGLPSQVFAMGGHWSHLEIDVEDTASALMRFFYHERDLPVYLHQDYLQRPARRTCEIIGDRAHVVADLRAVTVTLTEEDGHTTVNNYDGFDRNELFLAEMRHFLNCVENKEKPIVDLYMGLQSLRMALAIKKSITTRNVVALNAEAAFNE